MLAPEPVDESVTELRSTAAEPDAVALEEARFIVSAGAGVSDWSLFDRLAQTLRASRGGSRVVCDAGSVARERQIGASGITVTAECYLALGISGAPQHLSGIERCGYVIAVNRDRQAPIFGRANLGFVADSHELMQAVLDLAATQRPS
jgi:electron transfer flavoprotein alpha subunit